MFLFVLYIIKGYYIVFCHTYRHLLDPHSLISCFTVVARHKIKWPTKHLHSVEGNLNRIPEYHDLVLL